VERLSCRECGEETVLDPRRMNRAAESWRLKCHACGTEFPVRQADPHRVVPQGPPLPVPEPEKRRRSFFGRR
jgi:hypothetical protein